MTLEWGEDKDDLIASKSDQLHGVLYGLSCYDGILQTGKMVCTYTTVEKRKGVEEEKVMKREIQKLLHSNKSNLTFFDIDQNKTASLEWFNATAITCLCDIGYVLTDNGCIKCPKDKYGGGRNSTSCTACPDGRTTLGMEGATRKEECCRKNWYTVRSLGMCINFVALIALVIITMFVAAFIVMCGFKMLHEGKNAVDSAEHYPQCRNASRPTVLFRATSFALSARASLLSIVVRPTPD